MKKILNCTNLLGDSIYLLKPVKQFMKRFPEEVSCIVTDASLAHEMFVNSFAEYLGKVEILTGEDDARKFFPDDLVLYLGAGQSGKICFENAQKGGRQLHISEGYSVMLGMKGELAGGIPPLANWQRVPDDVRLPPFIGISPFSKSCSVHTTGIANKTLDDWKWEHIIRYLRKRDLPVKVFAGPNDYLKHCSVTLDDYICAKNLYDLELALKSCVMFVTLDNGLLHIASALKVPTIALWPKVSCIEFIAPVWSPLTTFLTMEPTKAAPMAILHSLRKVVRLIMEGQTNETLTEEEAP
jgi:hypothetical protein